MAAEQFMLRNQMKANSDDIDNFLRDLSNWEDEAKRKDQQLKNKNQGKDAATSQRNYIEMESPTTPINQRETFPSIPSKSSATPWKIESPGPQNKTPTVAQGFANNDTQNKQQALWEKDKGNEYFKANQWQKAIEHYSRAIALDSTAAVFPANRAMAHLKLQQYGEAEKDCSTALNLDPSYLKAYLRRATARTQLNKLELAKQDYEKVLAVEPANTPARTELDKIMQKLAEISKPKPVEKKTVSFQAPPPQQTLPSLYKVLGTVEPVNEPNQGVKQKIPLLKVQKDAKSGQFMENFLASLSSPPKTAEPVVPMDTTPQEVALQEVPPVPSTYVQFLLDWRKIRSHPQLRYIYLKQIPGDKIPSIFQQAMEAQNLTDILETLGLFMANKDSVFPLVKGLSQVKRLQALLLFLSPKETKMLKEVFAYMAETSDGPAGEREALCRFFSV